MSRARSAPPPSGAVARRTAWDRRWRAWRTRTTAAAAGPGMEPLEASELPAALLRRLEFTILRRLDGYVFGDQTGPFYGPSLDLAEVREYQPGDEVRRIDWSVTARTGTLHVRQYREEREVIAWLVVDRSASMRFGTRRLAKEQVALEFAAATAAVVARAGKVGALGFGPGGVRTTQLGGGRRQALAIVGDLMAPLRASAGAPAGRRGTAGTGPAPPGLGPALEQVHLTLRRRALVFVVSDFLDGTRVEDGSTPAWRRALALLAQRHDVVAVRISDPAERVLPAVGELRVRDLESGEELWLDTDDPAVRAEHARLVAGRDGVLARTFRSVGVDVVEVDTERGVLMPLLDFARQRRRGRR